MYVANSVALSWYNLPSQDVHGGLEKAADPLLGWKNEYRTIIHIADAPGHGSRLYDPDDASWMGDLEPNYDSDGTKLAELLLKLRIDIKVSKRKLRWSDPNLAGVSQTLTQRSTCWLKMWVFIVAPTQFPFAASEGKDAMMKMPNCVMNLFQYVWPNCFIADFNIKLSSHFSEKDLEDLERPPLFEVFQNFQVFVWKDTGMFFNETCNNLCSPNFNLITTQYGMDRSVRFS